MKDFGWECSIDSFDTDVKKIWNEGNHLPFYGGKPKISTTSPPPSVRRWVRAGGRNSAHVSSRLCRASSYLPNRQPSSLTQDGVPASGAPCHEFSGVSGEERKLFILGVPQSLQFLKRTQDGGFYEPTTSNNHQMQLKSEAHNFAKEAAPLFPSF